MSYRVIISGHLEFGSERSFYKILDMYEHKAEVYYKYDVALKSEDVFDQEQAVFSVPRHAGMASDRTWRNTINILEMVVQYSVAGSISAWKLDDGKLVEHKFLEPRGDKAAVQSFLAGRELIVEGKETEAKVALSKAIDKYERHALAYERRGYVNYILGNTEDALYDFSKSIDICPTSPDAFMGRAIIYLRQKEYEAAVKDLDMATKSSIPHQHIYWQARRMKGECHLKLEQYQKAEFELRLVTRRKFDKDNPNYKWTRKAFHEYGVALLGLEKYEAAIEAFNKSLEGVDGNEKIDEAEQFFYRGLALKKAGKKGYKQDLNKAADCGSNQAAQLLAGLA
jgi:tetratricopeptide (TPR) repeat protein